jgi:hypothetical protein
LIYYTFLKKIATYFYKNIEDTTEDIVAAK